MIRGWHHGRHRSTRSQRARELLTELVPSLLRAFGASANPDAALLRFDQFLARLPAGVQLFSLLYNAMPALLDSARRDHGVRGRGLPICWRAGRGCSTRVLSRGLLRPAAAAGRACRRARARSSPGARDYEELLDVARRWVGDRKFQVGVQLLRARLDGEAAGARLRRHRRDRDRRRCCRASPPNSRAATATVGGGGMVVLGLGKLGSREMTVTSDLDLILVYDAPRRWRRPTARARCRSRPITRG